MRPSPEELMRKIYDSDIFDKELSSLDVHKILHIKRFLECIVGDRKFRHAFLHDVSARDALLRDRGIFGLDHKQIALLVPKSENDVAAMEDIDFDLYPEVKLWKQWREAMACFQKQWLKKAGESCDERYAAWRMRQSNRACSQLGKLPSQAIVHALVAFELNKGCSMNCPFCGVAADPLQGAFAYTEENAQLFRNIVRVFVRRFGTAAGTAFCYWATDPSDNPDYLKFVKDIGDITGQYPQTTTAAPMRDIEWTKDLLKFRQTHLSNLDRFSILSSGILKRVHQTFTAEELALVELVCIGNHSLQLRSKAGRNIETQDKIVGSEEHGGTIACVSGYLLNMVDKTIKLISPCPASKTRPLGYRVYAEITFSDAQDIDQFIEMTIDQYMAEKVQMDHPLMFRDDLQYIPVDNGFHLKNNHFLHKIEGESYMKVIGDYIDGGEGTLRELLSILMDEYEVNIFSFSSCVQNLFERGLLSDEDDEILIDQNILTDIDSACARSI